MNPFTEVGPRRSGFYFLQGYYTHRIFCDWVKEHQKDIHDTLEYGCGYFEYYSLFFDRLRIVYTGLDCSKKIIDYRKSVNLEQEFIQANFETYREDGKYDLVFSHMVVSGQLGEVSNFALLKSTVEASNRFGYVVIWNMDGVNLQNYKDYLESLGCKNINSFSIPTGLPERQPKEEIILQWEQ